MENKFNVGTRVMCTQDDCFTDRTIRTKGKTGTVVSYENSDCILVNFDESVNGHFGSDDHLCDPGCGWYLPSYMLVKLETKSSS